MTDKEGGSKLAAIRYLKILSIRSQIYLCAAELRQRELELVGKYSAEIFHNEDNFHEDYMRKYGSDKVFLKYVYDFVSDVLDEYQEALSDKLGQFKYVQREVSINLIEE